MSSWCAVFARLAVYCSKLIFWETPRWIARSKPFVSVWTLCVWYVSWQLHPYSYLIWLHENSHFLALRTNIPKKCSVFMIISRHKGQCKMLRYSAAIRQYRSICCCTTRLQSSFFPQAVRLLNSSSVFQCKNSLNFQNPLQWQTFQIMI